MLIFWIFDIGICILWLILCSLWSILRRFCIRKNWIEWREIGLEVFFCLCILLMGGVLCMMFGSCDVGSMCVRCIFRWCLWWWRWWCWVICRCCRLLWLYWSGWFRFVDGGCFWWRRFVSVCWVFVCGCLGGSVKRFCSVLLMLLLMMFWCCVWCFWVGLGESEDF